MLPDLFSSKHLVYKLEVGLNVVVACCLLITPTFFFFWQNSIKDHAGSSFEYFSLFCKWVTSSISGLHVTSRRPYWWWRAKAFHSAGNYTLFSCTFFEKKKNLFYWPPTWPPCQPRITVITFIFGDSGSAFSVNPRDEWSYYSVKKVEYGVPVSSLWLGPKRNGVDDTEGQCLWIESLLTPPTNPASSYHFCRINKLYPKNQSLLFVACITLLVMRLFKSILFSDNFTWFYLFSTCSFYFWFCSVSI